MGLDQRERATAIEKTASAAQQECALLERSAAALHARIEKRFPSTQAFQLQVEFCAQPGITVFFGASGAGKTTILDCLAGLLPPDSGCVTVGERVLLPAVRNTPESAVIVSDGFSCREQILQSTGRRAIHLAEALQLGVTSK